MFPDCRNIGEIYEAHNFLDKIFNFIVDQNIHEFEEVLLLKLI